MNKKILSLALIMGALFLSINVALAQSNVNLKESTVAWKGKKVTGEHFGKVAIADAKLDLNKGRIKSGFFNIDMTSITVEDIQDANSNKRLTDHLKSDDFFSVEKFKQSNFQITEAKTSNGKDYQITGNLVIKGISQKITFPAKVETQGSKMTATAKIVFDRTKFDIKYRSGNYFENLADRLIYDDVEMEVKLVADMK